MLWLAQKCMSFHIRFQPARFYSDGLIDTLLHGVKSDHAFQPVVRIAAQPIYEFHCKTHTEPI
jgi:hypothetical protein